MAQRKNLNEYIVQVLNLEEGTEAFNRIAGHTVKYLMGGYASIADYHRDLSKWHTFTKDYTAAAFRIALSDHSRFTVNIKYFCLNVALAKDPRAVTMAKYKMYGLKHKEALLIWNSFLKEKKERAKALSYAKKRNPALVRSLTSAINMKKKLAQTQPIFEELHKNTMARVRKKLRWVSDSHNIPPIDLACDIMCSIIQAYHKSLPNNLEPEHQLNYLRRALENTVNNANNFYSADKRKRMEKVGENQYQMIVMSDNQLQYAMRNGDGEVNYENMLGEEDRNHTDMMETNLGIQRLLTRSEGTKKYKLYSAVLGIDTTEFTQWLDEKNLLGKNKVCASDWMVAKPAAYVKKTLALWLNVTLTAIECGISRLQSEMQYAG